MPRNRAIIAKSESSQYAFLYRSSNPPTDPGNWDEVRLTDASFDLEKAAHPSGAFFVGDYEALTTAGNDFIAAWSQPHDGDLDSVFVRRIGP